MAGKRKDNKGRVLPPNVSQKTDGRYIWRKLIEGKTYTVTDNDLQGLKAKIINKESDIQNGTCRDLGKATLNQYFDKYINLVDGIKPATKENYKSYWKWYIADSTIGKKQLRKIHNTEIVEVYKKLSEKLAYTTLQYVNNILYNCLDCAVHDDKLLPSNPCVRALSKIRKQEPKHREALTIEQQRLFIEYMAASRAYSIYLPLFAFFLGTGTRLGEATGITWNDIDLKESTVSINHTLSYRAIEGKRAFFISTPKTKGSFREIPLIDDLKKQLIIQKRYQLEAGIKRGYSIDNYSNFVFTTRNGVPFTPEAVNLVIRKVIEGSNLQEQERAAAEKRAPVLLPHFSAHVLRHTFCTRFCENENNIKVIQCVMGHSNIKTTMDIYNHATKEKTEEVMQGLNGKIKIS